MSMKQIRGLIVGLIAAAALVACGGGGSSGSGNVSISATATTTAQSLTVGTAMTSFTPLTPSGGTTPYTYSYGGTLPAGLSLNVSTGAVTGTPTATYATANVVFSVQDANAVVANTTSSVSITVGADTPSISATSTTTAQSLTVGTAMASFSPLTPSGGTTPYIFSITSGTLPAGLSFDASTGAVTGIPSAVYTAANVVFSVKDANNVVASTTSTVNFTVVAATPSISATASTTVQNLTVSTAMASFSPLTPSGGATPYTYSYGGTLPTGLSFNIGTGAITGIPTAPYTTANVVFSVQDAHGVVANTTSSVSFTVVAATPSISATAAATAQNLTVGTAMVSFSPLTPSGGATPYTYRVTSGTLPAGLSLNTSTGAVTGTPTATYSTANVVFSVQDAHGVVANTTSSVSFNVVAAIPSISATASTTAQNLTVGTAMASFTPLTPSGGAIPYTYRATSGTLPAGLSLNTSSGAVTGIPTAPYTTANVVFSVQDANGVVASTTSSVSFTVVAATPAISATATTTAQSLTVGTAMAGFSPLAASGGATPYTYSVTSGTLPAGLSLNTSTGAISGIPTAPYTTANVVFSVQDAHSVVVSTTSSVSFTVVAAIPAISATATTTAQSLTVSTAMASFSPLTPSGGATPYTYYVSSGALPAGLSLNTSSGTVTGIPTAPYTAASVVFSVMDANAVVASTTSTVSFTVVAATPVISATATTTAQSLTVGTAMASFSPLTPSGGVAPYTYSVVSGTLPAGVNLNASTGAVAGTPTATYTTANVVFSVQDAHGVTAGTTSTVSFTVVAATPSITAASTILSFNLTVGTPMVSLTPITASGGATPYTYYVSSGTLPAGLSLDASTGAVTGTPSAIYTAAVVYFSVKDANNVVASAISRIAFQVDVPAGYVYDGGLIWGQASPLIGFAYAQAASLCSSSTSLGLTGWRLPTGRELTILAIDSMAIPAYPLLGWTFDYTWSSDSTYGVGWHDIYDLTQGSIGTQMQDTDGNIHLVTCVH